jgi:hypothetical protein
VEGFETPWVTIAVRILADLGDDVDVAAVNGL